MHGFRLSCALAWASLLLALPQAARAATGMIIPVYGNTTSQFNATIDACRKVPAIVVINPDDGPGSSKISSIASKVSTIKGTGARVVGYISTAYGNVSSSDVKDQMDAYISYYGVNGFFLDEMADSSGKLGYYNGLKSYASGKGKIIVGNPGTFVPSSYAGAADVLVTYEDPYSAGWTSHNPVSWTRSQPATKFAAVVYSTASGNMTSVVDRAVSKNYGWVFAGDRGGADPFGAAPSYLSAEADYIAALNAGTTPPVVVPPIIPPTGTEFRIDTARVEPTGGMTLVFPTVIGQTYEVQISSDLATWTTATWADAPTTPMRGAVGSAVTTVTAHIPPGQARLYYRAARVTP